MSGVSLIDGWLAQRGLLSPEACELAEACIARAAADQIETVRVVFADQHGVLRGKTVTAERLRAVFTTGIRVPSTLLLKDTAHRTVFPVWQSGGASPMRNASDVLLVPRPETWRTSLGSDHAALVHCDVVSVEGEPIAFSSRRVLQAQIDRLAENGLACVFGLEVEFQVYSRTDTGELVPLNTGMQYLTDARYTDAEPVLDAIRRAAVAAGMQLQSVEIEMGPGQFECTFACADPMAIADLAVNFRTLASAVCKRLGYVASFMAKPRISGALGNGWHIHQSVISLGDQRNAFMPTDDALSPTASAWIGGLLANAEAACLLTTPTINGYKRYGEYQLAPNGIGWGSDNRGAMVRTLMAAGDPASRVENRVAESGANPYFALASQIACGLDGIEQSRVAPPPLVNPYEDIERRLPANLGAAIEAFAASETLRAAFGDAFVDYLTTIKRAEWQRYLDTVSEWEQAEYFDLF